ncbi:hypothetical protein [Clostridium sp.]|uniref:hypothetical protein n=1 Tax=Clostridium sp. TaxID=1506 RepID=UPI003216FB60
MNGFTTDNIVLLLVAIVLLILVIKVFKGVLKTIIAIILLLTVGVSCYNIFVAKKSITYEINRYKTDFAYTMDIKDISAEAYKIIDDMKEDTITEEGIDKLVHLKNQAEALEHSEEANFIHNKYISSLDGVILACRGYALGEIAQGQVSKLEDLTDDININLLDVLRGE